MSDTVKVVENGIGIQLLTGAHVAGFPTDEGGFAWLFTNRAGIKTPLALSKEAMEAVITIYGDLVTGVPRDQEPPGASRWVLVKETDPSTNHQE
jgi:hypothetical protein